VGEYKDGKRNGLGTYTFASGLKFVGQFKDDKPNGPGTYTFGNGRSNVGVFKDDRLSGLGTYTTASATQAPVPDPAKAERDRLTADLDASRKNAKDLEERLAAAQALTNNLPKPVAGSVRTAHALVIGNAAYPGSGRLDNPVNDANAISQKLRSMGFIVTMVTDANRQRLVQAVLFLEAAESRALRSVRFLSLRFTPCLASTTSFFACSRASKRDTCGYGPRPIGCLWSPTLTRKIHERGI